MSSLWYAQRVAEVVSVEHDPHWATLVRAVAPENCQVVLATEDHDYLDTISGFEAFDLVVIDGVRRTEAAIAALGNLTAAGVMIWDNSDWAEFLDVFPTLQEHGFKRIAFSGMGPVNRYGWETSVLYRDENCLSI